MVGIRSARVDVVLLWIVRSTAHHIDGRRILVGDAADNEPIGLRVVTREDASTAETVIGRHGRIECNATIVCVGELTATANPTVN